MSMFSWCNSLNNGQLRRQSCHYAWSFFILVSMVTTSKVTGLKTASLLKTKPSSILHPSKHHHMGYDLQDLGKGVHSTKPRAGHFPLFGQFEDRGTGRDFLRVVGIDVITLKKSFCADLVRLLHPPPPFLPPCRPPPPPCDQIRPCRHLEM